MDIIKVTTEVINETDKIIKLYGPRLAGTDASLKTADYLYEDAKKYSDEIYKQDFYINKGAFLGWIKILVLSYLIGFIFITFNFPVVNVILMTLSILILIFQFILYLPVIDFLFPRRKARNIYGIVEPKNEVKRQIIISGHHDSANIFNFFIHQPKLYGLRVTGSILFVVISLVLSVLSLIIKNNVFNYITIGVVGLGLLLVLQMWFFKSSKGTPGAGDNLVSSQIAFRLGKHFYSLKGKENELKHTRIIFASFDAEEEGLRGARAFVKTHEKMLKDTKTYLLNIECLYDENEMFFLTSDINNTVKLSNSLADDLISIAKDKEIKIHKQNIAVLTGGTDAGEFGKKNIEATTIMGMPWSNDNRSLFYHTPNDTISNVSINAIKHTLDIFYTYIIDKDLE